MTVRAASLLLAGLACGPSVQHANNHTATGGILITEERIKESGGKTAWEVIKRAAPVFSTHESRTGRPAGMERRGRVSILFEDSPIVMLDGVRVSDFKVLDQIPAETIFSIYILTGAEGTTYYGTNAGGGVIEIRTKDGSQD